jgi:hypothetical protein
VLRRDLQAAGVAASAAAAVVTGHRVVATAVATAARLAAGRRETLSRHVCKLLAAPDELATATPVHRPS